MRSTKRTMFPPGWGLAIGWGLPTLIGVFTLFARTGEAEARPDCPTCPPWPDAEPWEIEAATAGDVDPGHGHEPPPTTPVASGSPDDFCTSIPKLGAGPDDLAPVSCVVDPATHPDHAPAWRGAPQSTSPSSSIWPVLTKHKRRLVVSYWGPTGVRGDSGRTFGTLRHEDDGTERRHAGVDLFAEEGDIVVAPEDGHVLAILPFHEGSWALYLRSMLGDRIINLGEIEPPSWREFNIKKGQTVIQGQPLARIARLRKSTMLHVEVANVPETATDEDIEANIRARGWAWLAEHPPTILRDPSGYLLTAAHRTHQREQLFG